MRSLIRRFNTALVVVLAFGLTACRTLQYREVQRDFERAVQLDNQDQPFTEPYAPILATLTTNYIDRLDPKLRANAWMLRAISAWRSGQLAVARASAEMGQAVGPLRPNSRDAVILQMVPALVVDSELLLKWRAASNHCTADQYAASFARDFMTALRVFDKAQTEIGPATPDNVVTYLHFQRWRVLEDWRLVISGIEEEAGRNEARNEAERFLGKDLKAAAAAERDAIPPSHPLREFIRAKGGG